ncbi:hypothetical protein K503DRAFT_768446 [Rhizopogon vinicolor AM-OR11-026]|uniref:SH3 domain-containing protein n=1 Tax=Rhizopogon vinicolor AM-OR11-026 TaxID=1314800 RepID=A0A1B7N706_9AGAM|nr:hypothetical protein K503DRAFT_768446 [Rhizopogon vinicolor AM-OR11-026]
MVFTRLSSQEKDAFFGLLDEYFQSRPEIFAQVGDHAGDASSAAASAVHRALAKNPEATSKLVSAGVTHGLAKSNNPYASAIASSPGVSNSMGRVAAASLSFSGSGSSTSSPLNALRSQPPSLPQRSTSAISTSSSGSEIDKLVARKTGVLNAFKKGPTASVSIPPAFPQPKNNFGPPPVRRATSEANAAENSNSKSPPPSLPRRQAEPEPEPEEPQGEWADVLYDYSSEDPGDLEIQTGTRVFVTAKSSEDWWTGQIDGQGREGLFPASYVKLL